MDLELLKKRFKRAIGRWIDSPISMDEVFDDMIAPLFSEPQAAQPTVVKKPKWAVALTFVGDITDGKLDTALYLSRVRADTEMEARDKAYLRCMKKNKELRTMTLDHQEVISTK